MQNLRSLAIISGGSSGIGLACAEILAARGHRVALLARDRARLAAARDHILSRRPEAAVLTRSVDVGDGEACAATVAELVATEGAPAWVVASAGIARPGLFFDQPLQDHEEQLRTNYLGTLYLVRAAAPAMAAGGGGRIVLVASGAALHGIYGYSAYAPSKFAVRGLAEVLRVELAPHDISVTLAMPPDTATPQLAEEELTKPAATREITRGGGLWKPEKVAEKIIDAALTQRFFVGPGVPIVALATAVGFLGPFLRRKQNAIVKRHKLP